jgi:site-specific recombinase XerD
MSELRQLLEDYLVTRREFGFRLERAGRLLGQFVDLCDERGVDVVTTELALAWATLPLNCSRLWAANRLGVVRGFARYLHALDSRHGVPPASLLPDESHRATPYMYSITDIVALMRGAKAIASPLRAASYETIIGLLASSGLRVGEALALDRSDVDFEAGLLTIRHAKFNKTRAVPLHPSCVAALNSYAKRRDQLMPRRSEPAFFVSASGTRVRYCNFQDAFHKLVRESDIEQRARIHDLRHRFAVSVLTNWYAEGVDVTSRLPSLSTYMGHVSPLSTYWYLSASPALLALAATRLEATYEVMR